MVVLIIEHFFTSQTAQHKIRKSVSVLRQKKQKCSHEVISHRSNQGFQKHLETTDECSLSDTDRIRSNSQVEQRKGKSS